jgi:hypothetical protein
MTPEERAARAAARKATSAALADHTVTSEEKGEVLSALDHASCRFPVTARLADQNHPNGQRVRGGVTWTAEPQTHELTQAQADAVRADPALRVLATPEPDPEPDPDA